MNGVGGNFVTTGWISTNIANQVYESRPPFSFSGAVTKAVKKAEVGKTKKAESVVEEYKRKHPEDVSHVEAQVKAGKNYLSKTGADSYARDDMSMEEYQNFIMGILNSVPFDSSRLNDIEVISISEKGWEQMKNDPDYEAWVVGYTVENRSVRNPFAPLVSSFAVEKFGASIEEHHGQGFSVNRSEKKKEEKSWWEKRHERFEEMIEEQTKRAIARRKLASAQAAAHLNSQGYGYGDSEVSSALAAYEETLMSAADLLMMGKGKR